jgi:hypothetical protein
MFVGLSPFAKRSNNPPLRNPQYYQRDDLYALSFEVVVTTVLPGTPVTIKKLADKHHSSILKA